MSRRMLASNSSSCWRDSRLTSSDMPKNRDAGKSSQRSIRRRMRSTHSSASPFVESAGSLWKVETVGESDSFSMSGSIPEKRVEANRIIIGEGCRIHIIGSATHRARRLDCGLCASRLWQRCHDREPLNSEVPAARGQGPKHRLGEKSYVLRLLLEVVFFSLPCLYRLCL